MQLCGYLPSWLEGKGGDFPPQDDPGLGGERKGTEKEKVYDSEGAAYLSRHRHNTIKLGSRGRKRGGPE